MRFWLLGLGLLLLLNSCTIFRPSATSIVNSSRKAIRKIKALEYHGKLVLHLHSEQNSGHEDIRIYEGDVKILKDSTLKTLGYQVKLETPDKDLLVCTPDSFFFLLHYRKEMHASKLYEDRLIGLNNNYQNKGVKFIFINPAIGLEEGGETVADMAKKVNERNITFPYLADEGQKISQAFGATKTPEVFVLHNVNNEFVLKYKGAIDDNPQLETGVKDNYLRNAIDAILADRNVQAFDKRATGCLIKKY